MESPKKNAKYIYYWYVYGKLENHEDFKKYSVVALARAK